MPSRIAQLSILVIPLVLLAANTEPASTPEPQGKMLINLYAEEGSFVIDGISAVAGPAPLKPVISNTTYVLRDSANRVIATGRVHLPRYVVHERPDENGEFSGSAVPLSGSHTITIPYFKDAATIELRGGGRTLIRHPLDKIGTLGRSALPAFEPSDPPDFRGYLADLEKQMDRSFVKAALPASPEPPAKMVRVEGKIKVVGVKDYSLIRTVIEFRRQGAGEDIVITAETGDDGTYGKKLRSGIYLVSAKCYYKDPTLGGEEVILYPSPKIVGEFDTADGTLNFKWKLNKLFRGQLMVAGGQPIDGEVTILERNLTGSTHQPYFVMRSLTDDGGNFAIRLPQKLFVMVLVPNRHGPAGEAVRIVKVKQTKKPIKLFCPLLGAAGGEQFKKIWDIGPASQKLNMVFLAEAYTNIQESFTDSNGNGVWDGDLLLDENGNGVLDNEEYYFDRNRDDDYDPPEPFVDVNGDRICNRFERAKFEAYCAMNTAAFLNFFPFNQYQDTINFYTYWTASTHGVQRFLQALPWQNMSTSYGIYCSGTGNRQGGMVPRGFSLEAFVDNLLPAGRENLAVAMVHDPFNALRANGSYNFGRTVMSGEDIRSGTVLIHEMGHAIGSLADEYLYLPYNIPLDYEPDFANATMESDPTKVKWGDLVKPGTPVPTPTNYEGYGLFEGFAIYQENAYRPTHTSMMRNTDYAFYEVNARQLRKVLDQFR